jgi:hypothetical protein
VASSGADQQPAPVLVKNKSPPVRQHQEMHSQQDSKVPPSPNNGSAVTTGKEGEKDGALSKLALPSPSSSSSAAAAAEGAPRTTGKSVENQQEAGNSSSPAVPSAEAASASSGSVDAGNQGPSNSSLPQAATQAPIAPSTPVAGPPPSGDPASGQAVSTTNNATVFAGAPPVAS